MIQTRSGVTTWLNGNHPQDQEKGGLELKTWTGLAEQLGFTGFGSTRIIKTAPGSILLNSMIKLTRALFFASTVIAVGDGKSTTFWEPRCLNGVSPVSIPARATPRTFGRVTLGHPTPPRCRGHHLRARGARLCVITDRFHTTPLPPPAGHCAAMLGPGSVPTSFIRTVTCRQPHQSNPFPPGFLCRWHLGRLPLGAGPSHVVGAAEPRRHVTQNKCVKTTPL
jgi:hypothetical protein